jgi:hypothetical protein
MMMLFLIAVFLLCGIVMMYVSEDPELDEKRRINRMADASRKGKPAPVRQRSRYIQAGLRIK